MKEHPNPSSGAKLFVYRSYIKSELAQLYVPDRSQRTAIRTFNKWLRRQPQFWRRLQCTGVDINTQVFSTYQVKLIVEFLGEP